MIIEFATRELKDICENEKSMRRKYGSLCAEKIKTRLMDLLSVTNVGELIAGRPHPLKGKRLGQFSLSLHGGTKLILECADEPIPRTCDHAIDWNAVTCVCILSIEDYHD
ncbi:MAG: hypothetical protein WC222_03295 [Parachlamydiales bacterium]